MVRIAISREAYDAIVQTLPLGSVAVEPYFNAKGEREIWLDEVYVDRLAGLRGAGESYSDVILRIAAAEAAERRSLGGGAPSGGRRWSNTGRQFCLRRAQQAVGGGECCVA